MSSPADDPQARLRDRRLVFVLPSLEGGGAERISLSFLAGVAALGADLHLVLLSARGPLLSEIPDGVTLHDLGCRRLRQALPSLFDILRKLQPDLVYSTQGYVNVPLLAMRPFLGRTVSLLLREANTPSASLAHQRFRWFFRLAYRLLYPQADALICQSERMRTELMRDYAVPAARLHLIHNPTSEAAIRQGLVPQREPGPGLRFVAAGSLTAKKGFDRLIDWFARMPKTAHLTILGQGPMESSLRNQAAELGLSGQISLLGFIAKPWSYFAGADAFLLPSRWEGMPNVALEALACGTAVIAMREAGGIEEVATMAPIGAVALADDGECFTAAMQAINTRTFPLILGPSLLPSRFDSGYALDSFNVLMSRLVQSQGA